MFTKARLHVTINDKDSYERGILILMCTISEKEYDKLIQKLSFYDTTRNALLTFSFTAVLAVLGVALTVELNIVSSCVCLVPFLLIIPFSARISYYRLASAHINSFLKLFATKNMQFEIGTSTVTENQIPSYKLLAWLVNHEMFLLGIATSCIFYINYIPFVIKSFNFWIGIVIVIPILLNLFVFIICDSTYSYKNLMTKFTHEWMIYDQNRTTQDNVID